MSQKAKAKQQYSIFDTLGPIGAKALYKASDICLLIDDKGYILGIISESDLFNALLMAEKERNEEDLS